jgi:hypothetical protein
VVLGQPSIIIVAYSRRALTSGLAAGRGLRLRANHRYRVVAVYDNPTGRVIEGGAMGFVAGAFIPENVAALEQVNVNDVAYARDARMLLGGVRPSRAASGHSHH